MLSNAELIEQADDLRGDDSGVFDMMHKLKDALEVAEQELAAAQAVIAEVKRYAEDREAYGKRGRTVHSARIASDLLAILSQSSADALQAHDREVAAKALLDAADDLTPGDDKVDDWGIEAGMLRARAAALGVPEEAEHG